MTQDNRAIISVQAVNVMPPIGYAKPAKGKAYTSLFDEASHIAPEKPKPAPVQKPAVARVSIDEIRAQAKRDQSGKVKAWRGLVGFKTTVKPLPFINGDYATPRQDQIVNLLREHGPMTRGQLSKLTGTGEKSVSDQLCKLRRAKRIVSARQGNNASIHSAVEGGK